jgi:acyl-CoA synthetase (AMP-forming)/AMP-acid ligase II
MAYPDPRSTVARSVVEACQRRAKAYSTRVGFTFKRDEDESPLELTFGELDRRARAIAAELREHARPGARALLHYPPGLEFVRAFFGCLYAGMIAVPAAGLERRPKAKAEARSRAIVEGCRPELWLLEAGARERLDPTLLEAAGLSTLCAVATDLVESTKAARWQPPPIEASSIAYLQYSSGTTGVPKGVMVTHANALHNVASIRDLCTDGPAPVGALWLPMFHDMGLVAGALLPVVTGGRVKLLSPLEFLHEPFRWLALLDEPNSISAAPAFAYDLCAQRVTDAQLEQLDLSGWSCAIVGAERVRPATLERFAERFASSGFSCESFVPCYGLAESTLLVTGGPRGRGPTVHHLGRRALARHEVASATVGAASVSLIGCGEPRPGARVVIADPETLRPRSPGEIGEVCVAGPSVGAGYWGAAAHTRETFGLRVEGLHGSYVRTGDLGALVEGELVISGRRQDIIAIAGEHHYPLDLEATVDAAHPAIRRGFCAVVAVDDGGGQRVVVLTELSVRALRRSAIAPGEIAAAVRRRVLADHSVAVDDVVLLRPGTLPFTSSGKLQRYACRVAYVAGELDHRRVEQLGDHTQVA